MKRLSLLVIGALILGMGMVETLHADEDEGDIRIRPIGHVEKTETQTFIVLEQQYKPGLLGLEGFSHVYVFWWFDENDTPKGRSVLRVYPMGDRRHPRTGVFAARSPRRPNLIALTLCKIVAVKDNKVQVKEIDAFEGTPVLDMKPVIPGYDTAKDARVPDWLNNARR
ncbi:MAG: SAM-dependent methyltransferase [Planctomycetota bacterium]